MAQKRRDMPPLPPHVLRKLEQLGDELAKKLAREFIWSNSANEYLRGYAVELFTTYYDGYSKFPKRKSEWGVASMINATSYAMSIVRGENPHITGGEINHFNEIILQTLTDHIEETLAPDEPLAPAETSASIAEQLKSLKRERRTTFAKIAAGIKIDIRNVQRHFADDSTPRDDQIYAYEKYFSELLGRVVKIKTP